MSKFDDLINSYDYLFTKQYRIDESGVTHGQYDREKDTFKSDATVSQKPILPVAILDNLDNEVQKVEVAWWEAEKGKWVRTVTNRETLVNSSKITKLADRGVPVGSQNSKSMSNYFNTLLCEFDGRLPRKPARSVMGWCELDDRLLFMPYTDLVDFDGGERYKDDFKSIRSKGKLSEWVERIGAIRCNTMEVRLMMAASFASPLIWLVSENPFVFHLYGNSGSGKTVSMYIAASIWGDPAPGRLTKSMNTTINAMMERAAFLNSFPFLGDELQTIKNRWTGTYDSLIMQITEGINRGRMKDNVLQEMLYWTCAFLFTGEEPAVKSTSGGGVVNRCIQVEIKQPLFDTTGPDSGNNYVNFVLNHYGTAGQPYIERVMAINAGLAPVDYSIIGLYKKCYADLVQGDTTEKQAGAMALMLTADKIAHDLWWAETEEELDADLVREYLATRENVNVSKRAYKYVLGVIAENSMNFTSGSRVIWGKVDNDENPTRIDFIKTVLERVLKDATFDFDAVKKPWSANGSIEYNAKNRSYQFLTRINGVPTWCVRINLPKTEPEFTDHTGSTPFDAE